MRYKVLRQISAGKKDRPRHMNPLKIVSMECEATPGTEIQHAVEKGLILAKQHNCRVEFRFNDIPFRLTPTSESKAVVDAYFKRMNQSPIQ